MGHLTRQERQALIILVLVFIGGTGIDMGARSVPYLWGLVNLADSDRIIPKVDVNTAGMDDLVKVPGIGPVTARRICDYRRDKGRLRVLDELAEVPGISARDLATLRRHLICR